MIAMRITTASESRFQTLKSRGAIYFDSANKTKPLKTTDAKSVNAAASDIKTPLPPRLISGVNISHASTLELIG